MAKRKPEPQPSLSEYKAEWQAEHRSAVRIMFNAEDFAHLVEMLLEHAPDDHLTLRLRALQAKKGK